MVITIHAEERIRERCGIKKKAVARYAKNAYEKGLTFDEAESRLKAYIREIEAHNDRVNSSTRLFGDNVFIFADNVLVTVFGIPHQHKPALHQAIRTKREAVVA